MTDYSLSTAERRKLGICQNQTSRCASRVEVTKLATGRVEDRFCGNCLRQMSWYQPPTRPLAKRNIASLAQLQDYLQAREVSHEIDKAMGLQGGFKTTMPHARR